MDAECAGPPLPALGVELDALANAQVVSNSRGHAYRRLYVAGAPSSSPAGMDAASAGFRQARLLEAVRSDVRHDDDLVLDWRVLGYPSGADELQPVLSAVEDHAESIPQLAHDLGRVLDYRGVHPLLCMQTQRYNFTPYLRVIRQPQEIAWERIPPYTPASRDEALHEVAQAVGARYKASTSSMTGVLTALYHAVSGFRDPCLDGLSAFFQQQARYFTRHAHRPVSVVLRPHQGLISVDASKMVPCAETILMDLGHSMERMLTMEPQQFHRKLLRGQTTGADALSSRQAYNYSRVGDFLLRAQLDCRHPRTGEPFDLKTRAAAPIRWDLDNYRDHLAYRITKLYGPMFSYEREFYDMVRSVFIKYCFQLRVGRMSGAFITYHNTRECFGFEYVSLAEMERYVFGSAAWARQSFFACMGLFAQVLQRAVDPWRDADGQLREPVKLTVEPTRQRGQLRVYLQRLRLTERGEHDPLSPDRLLQWSAAPGTCSATELADAVLGPPGAGDTANAEASFVQEGDLRAYTLHVAPCVNGSRIVSDAVNFHAGDVYDLLYAFSPPESPLPIASYVTALRRSYGIDDMPRLRPAD